MIPNRKLPQSPFDTCTVPAGFSDLGFSDHFGFSDHELGVWDDQYINRTLGLATSIVSTKTGRYTQRALHFKKIKDENTQNLSSKLIKLQEKKTPEKL